MYVCAPGFVNPRPQPRLIDAYRYVSLLMVTLVGLKAGASNDMVFKRAVIVAVRECSSSRYVSLLMVPLVELMVTLVRECSSNR